MADKFGRTFLAWYGEVEDEYGKKWQYQVFAFERVNGSKRPPVHLQQSHHSVRCRIAHELEYEGINEYVWQCSKNYHTQYVLAH